MFAAGIGPVAAEETPPLAASWLAQARIGGARLFAEMTASAIERNLAALVAQNVSVVEADSNFSGFLTDEEFENEIRFMRRYTSAAHRLGLRVVWYVSTLEVLSAKSPRGRPTISQAHPDWVQHGLNGKPNIYVGRAPGTPGFVHWVDPDTESAWMSIHSPYADLFLARIKKIAATGIDGIWLDVPLFSELGAAWPDTSPGAAAKFKADTGMSVPTKVDWTDPVWRRWIAWRYREISGFLLRIRDTAKSVSKDISVIVETVTLDYGLATLVALDGSLLKNAPDIVQAWEVDVVSDETAMREAQPDDWISLIGMAKFAKGASGRKPSWMFVYGDQPEDSLLVMAEALAAGNNPLESKVPKMTVTAGTSYRRHIYSWIKQQEKRLFASASGAKVAVYFSPESRDYLDKAEGTGLYTVIRPKDTIWWSNVPADSLYRRTYLAEYRGMIKWLVHNHVPFDIVVRPRADELSAYDTVIAPSLAAISNAEAAVLDGYVANGGRLVVTGPESTTLDEYGNPRPAPAVAALDRDRPRPAAASSASPASPAAPKSAGSALHTDQLVGKSYLMSGSPPASAAIGELLGDRVRRLLTTDAAASVHVEVRTLGDEMLLHLTDPERLWNKQAPEKRDVAVSLALPPGRTVSDVRLSSPEPLSPQAASQLPFSVSGDRVSFKIPLKAYAMVIISTRP